MAKPIFDAAELQDFQKKLTEIENDKLNFPDYENRESAQNCIRNAFFAQAVSRIRQNRLNDFINYLLLLVGSKGEKANIRVWDGFNLADDEKYIDLIKQFDTPLNRRYVHMYLKAILVAYRSWALTAFVKFIRGNKVAGGKANQLEGFGYFHKDSGWTEAQVHAVSDVLFSSWSATAKVFMQYDPKLSERVYEESEKNWEIPYSAQFAATSRTVNEEFIKELIAMLEKSELAPLPTNSKRAFAPHVPKEFKENDLIRKNTICDLPPLSIIEIKVIARMKSGEPNLPETVQIILVTPPAPRCYLNIWRIADGKAYLPYRDHYMFDYDRKSLEGATFKGIWENGVQAQKPPYRYPHNYIGLDKNI